MGETVYFKNRMKAHLKGRKNIKQVSSRKSIRSIFKFISYKKLFSYEP
ncbi:hypothetical protein [Lysinibacillus fusiformis]